MHLKRWIASLILMIAVPAIAGVDVETDANDVTLAGHDPVAYFTDNKPVLGKPEITAVHEGAIFRFASKANRDRFRADPKVYAPAYGGYCALGISLGAKFPVNGKSFHIQDGRLYVNKDASVGRDWAKAIPQNIQEADVKWPGAKDVPAEDLLAALKAKSKKK